jgi:hypothetical protein
MSKFMLAASCAAALLFLLPSSPQAQSAVEATKPAYDAELARALGADELGMRRYVLVILKTGPNKVPAAWSATRCSRATSRT